MLSRTLSTKTKSLRAFSSFYTWGSRTANLGHDNETSSPQSVDFSGIGTITQAAMGLNHTLLLNGDGQLFAFGYGGQGAVGTGGTDQYDSPQRISIGGDSPIVDFDAGCVHSIAVNSNGNVYTWGSSSSIPEFFEDFLLPVNPLGHGNTGDLRTPTKIESLSGENIGLVAAGQHHSVAVNVDGNQVWMWGNGEPGTFCDPFVQHIAYPTQVDELNNWINSENIIIVDVKASGDSTVVLTSDGSLWGWGGNANGQLANNHDRLSIEYKGVYEPYQISGYEGTILGFDLSDDVIVFYTDAGCAYWAGRYEQFVPQQVTLPFEGTITSVGATESGFAITCDNGNVFTFGETLKTEKQFFDQGLSLSNSADFNGQTVVSVGGSYQNNFAIAN